MSIKNKHGQITIFMIVGILILASAAFYFYQSGKKAEVAEVSTRVDTKAIENYINTCLQNSLKKNLLLLGHQGGAIYRSQNGPWPDFTLPEQKGIYYLGDANEKTPFLIDKPYGKAGVFESEAPVYPWPGFPMMFGSKVYSGYFGINRLPSLDFGAYSFAELLKSAITPEITLCKLDVFENNFDITKETPNVEIVFGDAATFANLTYSMTVTDRKTKATKEISSFSATIPVSLLRLHRFLERIIEQDTENITFDIRNASSNEFTVNVDHDVIGQDDMITITARNAKIDGKPYEFKFGRKNRIPALGVVTLSQIDLAANPNLPGILSFEVHDPDEDAVIVRYKVNDTQVSLPRAITKGDCDNPAFSIRVTISDGQYEDSQLLRKGMDFSCKPTGN